MKISILDDYFDTNAAVELTFGLIFAAMRQIPQHTQALKGEER